MIQPVHAGIAPQDEPARIPNEQLIYNPDGADTWLKP